MVILYPWLALSITLALIVAMSACSFGLVLVERRYRLAPVVIHVIVLSTSLVLVVGVVGALVLLGDALAPAPPRCVPHCVSL